MVSEILPVKNQTICFTLTKWNTIWNIAAKLWSWKNNHYSIGYLLEVREILVNILPLRGPGKYLPIIPSVGVNFLKMSKKFRKLPKMSHSKFFKNSGNADAPCDLLSEKSSHQSKCLCCSNPCLLSRHIDDLQKFSFWRKFWRYFLKKISQPFHILKMTRFHDFSLFFDVLVLNYC